MKYVLAALVLLGLFAVPFGLALASAAHWMVASVLRARFRLRRRIDFDLRRAGLWARIEKQFAKLDKRLGTYVPQPGIDAGIGDPKFDARMVLRTTEPRAVAEAVR